MSEVRSDTLGGDSTSSQPFDQEIAKISVNLTLESEVDPSKYYSTSESVAILLKNFLDEVRHKIKNVAL